MRRQRRYVALVVVALLGLAPIGWTQEAVRLTIHSVTTETSATGDVVLVITGIGFGENPEVMVDGQSAAVLAGSSDTRLTVVAPPPLPENTIAAIHRQLHASANSAQPRLIL